MTRRATTIREGDWGPLTDSQVMAYARNLGATGTVTIERVDGAIYVTEDPTKPPNAPVPGAETWCPEAVGWRAR